MTAKIFELRSGKKSIREIASEVGATTAGQNIANLLAAIPEELWWLFGTGYLGYTGARSFDKRRKGSPF